MIQRALDRPGKSLPTIRLSTPISITTATLLLVLTHPPATASELPPASGGYAAAAPVDIGSERSEGTLPPDPGLEEYLRYAALHNAGLRATYHEWIAATEEILQAESLPDPRLSYSYYFESVETRVGAQRQRIGLAQTFPWLGKRRLRGNVAAAIADEKLQRFEASKFDLFFRIAEAYTEYYYLARSIDVTRESIELLSYWEKLTQAKYRVGTGRHPDIIRVQVELGVLTDRLRTLEELRSPLVARLNASLNRPPQLPLPWPTRLEPATVSLDQRGLVGELGSTSPDLRALDAAISREEHAIDLAKKDYYPDVTFGLQWIETKSRSVDDLRNNGQDAIIGGITVNLPVWWEKYGAGVREAEARRTAAHERRNHRESELSSNLSLALYKFRDAERKVDLYGNGLLPKAREAIAATFAAYESGESDFLDLLDAQQVLLDFQLSHYRALADQERYLAESEMLVGHSLRDPPPTETEENDR